jgi:AcrR family transcriptional regulator
MPRISAPTVAENRDLRRGSLLAAARRILTEEGSAGLTMTALATSAGLSRSAVYEYFGSVDEVVAHLVVDEMIAWRASIDHDLASTRDAAEAVEVYLDRSLDYVAGGHGVITSALEGRSIPEVCRAELARLGSSLSAPLAAALRSHGVARADRVADHVHGVALAAGRRIDAGGSAAAERRAAREFALGGLAAQRSPVPRRSASRTSRSTSVG